MSMDVRSLLSLIGLAALIVVISIPPLLLWAALRNSFVRLIHAGFEFIAVLFTIPARAVGQLIPLVGRSIGSVMHGLAYSSRAAPASDHPDDAWVGWDVIGPLVYLGFFTLLLAGDLWFSVLGFAALLNQPVGLPDLGVDLDGLAGLLFVAVFAFFGFLLFDLGGATPIRRPWENFSEGSRQFLKRLVVVAFVAVTLAGVAFWVWRALQQSSSPPPDAIDTFLRLFLWAILAIGIALACALAGWACFVCWGSFVAISLMGSQALLHLVFGFCRAVVAVLDMAAALVTAIQDIPARLGIGLWNWACHFHLAKVAHFEPIVPIERPPVGQNLAEPLFPTTTALGEPKARGIQEAAQAPSS
jgi:hypothetical protein